MTRLNAYGAAVVVLVLAGFGLGWYYFRPAPPKPETYAPAKVQADRSKVLERKPDAAAKPAHEVPRDAKVERIVRVSVEPERSANGPVDTQEYCPVLDVDLTLVRLPDESRRVIASSPNGRIIGGVDIPVESARVYKELKWAAGVSYNPLDRGFGGWLDRDLGPFRLGAELNQIKDGFDARLKAGMRF